MRRRGFTLLELLVATAIFAVVMSAAYALLGAGRDVASRAEIRAQSFQTARAALKAVEDDLRGAILPGSAFDTGFIGTSGEQDGVPADTLEVVAINHWPNRSPDPSDLPDRQTDLSRVIYRIDEGTTSSPRRRLVRERHTVLTPVTIQEGLEENVEEVAADVVGLDFRYFGDDWEETWDTTTRKKLPRVIEAAVYVRSVWREEEHVERFATRFYLPVGAETPERTQ